MKHFAAEAWLNFVRHLAPPALATQMQRHLDDGCKRCLKLCETWREVADIALREDAYKPPESVVRLAKSAYALRQWKVIPGTPGKVWLIFDSFLQPAPVGVRSSGFPARQLLFRAGRFLIDMRIEPQPEQKRFFLAGQVVNSKQLDHGLKGVEVSLLGEGGIVAQNTASPFGEFQMEFAAATNLRLLLEVPGHKVIGIPLPDPEIPVIQQPGN
jgi:hypothetical protein